MLVTGGTSGIGHAVATAFAAAGASVTVTGTRASAADYDTDLSAFTFRRLEMRDAAAVDALAAGLDTLDVLVNNAGANFPDGLDEWSPEGFSASLAHERRGRPAAHRAAPGTRWPASSMAGGASVVNVISMTAFRSTTIVPGYSASKAALLALTRNLAVHWAGDGIRVNAVAPGPHRHADDRADEVDARDARGRARPRACWAGWAPRRRSPPPCCSCRCEASSFTTGAVFAVDGGYLAK